MVQSDQKISAAIEEQKLFEECEVLKKKTAEQDATIKTFESVKAKSEADLKEASKQTEALKKELDETRKAKEKLEETLKAKEKKPPTQTVPEFDILDRKKEIQKERRCSGQTAMYLAHREFLQKIREMADK